MSQNGTPPNLDRLAAKRAQRLIDRAKSAGGKPDGVDNLVTKTLGVLQVNGVYACTLYLLSRTQQAEKGIAAIVHDELLNVAVSLPFGWQRPGNGAAAALQFYSETVANDLESLLLTKEVFEQMLIYARYGAKAWAAETPSETP